MEHEEDRAGDECTRGGVIFFSSGNDVSGKYKKANGEQGLIDDCDSRIVPASRRPAAFSRRARGRRSDTRTRDTRRSLATTWGGRDHPWAKERPRIIQRNGGPGTFLSGFHRTQAGASPVSCNLTPARGSAPGLRKTRELDERAS